MTKLYLDIPKPCPLEGKLFKEELFYYQPPQVFKLYAKQEQDKSHPALAFSPLDFEEIFPGFSPQSSLHIEFCSGNGDWVLSKAAQDKTVYWVAIEKRLDRARKIWSKRKKQGLNNLFVVCSEAELFSKTKLKAAAFFQIAINFPDPWPKDKHAKHRLIQASFSKELSRLLSEEGELMLVTDDKPYCEQMIEVLSQNPELKARYEKGYTLDFENYGNSYFDTLWREKGRDIHYLSYLKR